MSGYVPPSAEVIAEDIAVMLDKNGLPRCEQGEFLRTFVRGVAEEIAAAGRGVWTLDEWAELSEGWPDA